MFNSNRMLRLSGLTSHDEYKSDLLLEGYDVEEGVYEAEEEVEMGEEEVEMDDEESTDAEEEDTLAEARVRRVVRKEIAAVLREYLTAVDNGFQRAQVKKSLTLANTWASGQVHTPKKNKSAHRGIGRSQGFGGPGFM
jgi:hypothetical protein